MAGCCASKACKAPGTPSYSGDTLRGEQSESLASSPLLKKEPNATTPLNASFPTSAILFRVQGMDCAGCAATVENIIDGFRGVVDRTVSFTISQLLVVYNPSLTSVEALQAHIETNGYSCRIATNSAEEMLDSLTRDAETAHLRIRFLQSLCFSVPLFVVTDLLQYVSPHSILILRIIRGLYLADLSALLLTLPLLFVSRRFFYSAWRALRRGTTNVDSLITLGIATASFYSLLAMLVSIAQRSDTRPETFFETAGELVSFILFGRWLESKCSGSFTSSIVNLVKLMPTVGILLKSGGESVVDVSSIAVGDNLLSRTGTQFAADATVIEGEGEVDESMLTGNFVPVRKLVGDRVAAGTRNLGPSLTSKVECIGEATQLSRIIALLQEAQTGKGTMQLFADRCASYFTPIILVLSLATFLIWLQLNPTRHLGQGLKEFPTGRLMSSLKIAIAVIVVSCPCALSVATPAAVACGTGVGAQNGILIKGARVLENMAKISDVVFDKTGTLTIGKMRIICVRLSDFWKTQEADLWNLVAIAEESFGLNHPVAQAMISHASGYTSAAVHPSVSVTDVTIVAGKGIVGTISDSTSFMDGMKIVLGNKKLITDHGVKVPSNRELLVPSDLEEGPTQIYIAIDEMFAGTFLMNDVVKPDAFLTTQLLQQMGKKVWMLTGDSRSSALTTGQLVGIPASQIVSDCTISDKAAFINRLQRSGRSAAMVGDGVNDGPALATASVGISLSGASEVALSTADIVLLRPGVLRDVAVSLKLSEDVFRRIKLNLIFAFAWNAIGIPFAMGLLLPVGIYLPPALAGALMSVSCLCIICSSLLLKRWRVPAVMTTSEERERKDPRLQAAVRCSV